MTDHPDFEPLRRVDPSEPDEPEDIGRLEPLDPDADEAPAGSAATLTVPEPSAAPSRPRDGLALAVALAVLLAVSSIAAIAGVVALSAPTADPGSAPAVIAPIEAARAIPPIQVGRAVEERGEPAQEPSGEAAEASAPAAIPPPAPPKPDRGGGGDGDRDGVHPAPDVLLAPGSGGAWCDAAPGTACDATPEGGVAIPPVSPEDDAFVPDDQGEDGA